MLIYRIEHKDHGEGPYKNGNFGKKLCNDHFNKNSHPCFEEDGINQHPKFIGVQVAGFDSEKKMVAWFKGYGKRLKRNGYKIFIYKVDKSDVIFGKSGRQLAFIKPMFDLPTKKPINFE